MASMNLNPFESWFSKPPKPVPFILPKPPSFSFSFSFLSKPTPSPLFASLSSSGLYREAMGLDDPDPNQNPPPDPEPEEPMGPHTEMLEQFFWECENRPDYRHTPEVEAILKRDPIFEEKENPTEEEIRENEEFLKKIRADPVFRFLAEAEEIADEVNRIALKENERPFWREDAKVWRSVPHVIGPDGRPMPRKAIKTVEERDNKFWDFARQFYFGLWGYHQRPYPPGRPIDVAQAFGYKRLEDRYYDFIMKSGGFYYKDRLGRTRGPCELIQLKTAWGGGIIDKHTFIWGDDMDEWVPIHMLYGMERAIATWEVRLGAAATAFLHKLQKGIPPWVPLKGFEKKTFKQLQEEAYESKRRDLAVLEANDGDWPGERIPSHALFLWAGGSELTTMLERDEGRMPNKFIPKDLRLQLAKIIPDLRPWEVLSVEEAMDKLTYQGKWYREPFGEFTNGLLYINEKNRNINEMMEQAAKASGELCQKSDLTGKLFDKMTDKLSEHDLFEYEQWKTQYAQKMRAAEDEKTYRTLVGDDGSPLPEDKNVDGGNKGEGQEGKDDGSDDDDGDIGDYYEEPEEPEDYLRGEDTYYEQ